MAGKRQVPAPMPTEELADLLTQMAEALRTGDSLEGSITYQLDYEDEAPKDGGNWHMVQASVRTGNRNGQGGMIMFGKMVEVPEETP